VKEGDGLSAIGQRRLQEDGCKKTARGGREEDERATGEAVRPKIEKNAKTAKTAKAAKSAKATRGRHDRREESQATSAVCRSPG
jgi:hypothetical protein